MTQRDYRGQRDDNRSGQAQMDQYADSNRQYGSNPQGAPARSDDYGSGQRNYGSRDSRSGQDDYRADPTQNTYGRYGAPDVHGAPSGGYRGQEERGNGGSQRGQDFHNDQRDTSQGYYSQGRQGSYGGGQSAYPNDHYNQSGYGQYGNDRYSEQGRYQGPNQGGYQGGQSGYGGYGQQDFNRGPGYQGNYGDGGSSRHDYGRPSGWAAQQRNLGDDESQRGQHHDPDYHQWREQQLRNLDDDYQSWRGERYKKFSDEFSEWRKNRSTQDTGSANKRSTASGTGSSSGTSSTSVGTGSGSGNSGTSGSK